MPIRHVCIYDRRGSGVIQRFALKATNERGEIDKSVCGTTDKFGQEQVHRGAISAARGGVGTVWIQELQP